MFLINRIFFVKKYQVSTYWDVYTRVYSIETIFFIKNLKFYFSSKKSMRMTLKFYCNFILEYEDLIFNHSSFWRAASQIHNGTNQSFDWSRMHNLIVVSIYKWLADFLLINIGENCENWTFFKHKKQENILDYWWDKCWWGYSCE